MPRFYVRHHEAVWETTAFFVDLPEPLPEGYESYSGFVEENFVDLFDEALKAGRATIECSEDVSGIDSDIEVEPIP